MQTFSCFIWLHSSALGDVVSGAAGGLSTERFSQCTFSRRLCSSRGEQKTVRAFRRLLPPFWNQCPSHPAPPSECHPTCPYCCRTLASSSWVSSPSPHTTVQTWDGGIVWQCMVTQEDLQNETVPCMSSAKPETIFSFSVFSKCFHRVLATALALLSWIGAGLLPALLRAVSSKLQEDLYFKWPEVCLEYM